MKRSSDELAIPIVRNFLMKKPKWSLAWDDGMSIGIPEIDDDHKRFIFLINELNRSISGRMKSTEIHKRLQLLVEDVARHFAEEEIQFRKRQFPNVDSHASSHRQILLSLKNIQDSFMPYGLEAEWLDAALVIKNLLISHILDEDMQYATRFKANKSR